jgi:hypothetical protein
MSDDTNTTNTGFTPLPDEHGTGTPVARVATQRIAITAEQREQFGISEEFAKARPVLTDLLLRTESMDDEERRYWFQLLPAMAPEQVVKLQEILQKERDSLQALDTKYAGEIDKLNQQKLLEWQTAKAAKARAERHAAENKVEGAESQTEAELLQQIDNL